MFQWDFQPAPFRSVCNLQWCLDFLFLFFRGEMQQFLASVQSSADGLSLSFTRWATTWWWGWGWVVLLSPSCFRFISYFLILLLHVSLSVCVCVLQCRGGVLTTWKQKAQGEHKPPSTLWLGLGFKLTSCLCTRFLTLTGIKHLTPT